MERTFQNAISARSSAVIITGSAPDAPRMERGRPSRDQIQSSDSRGVANRKQSGQAIIAVSGPMSGKARLLPSLSMAAHPQTARSSRRAGRKMQVAGSSSEDE